MVTLIDKGRDARPRHPEKANRPEAEMLRKPDWIRVRAPGSPVYRETQQIVRENNLVTVCEEAGCPNIGECWSKKHATFMIMGEICTRACAFCNVRTGLPTALDPLEPEHVAVAVEKLGLEHVVITSVDRDDLPDGGARHFAEVIRAIRARNPRTTIEILTPDFLRKDGALEIVVAANNYSTPGSLTKGIRVLRDAQDNWVATRRIWNQHAYHVTNIEEDGTVPMTPRVNWQEPGLNNFRQNVQGGSLFNAPNFVVSVDEVRAQNCALAGVQITESCGCPISRMWLT